MLKRWPSWLAVLLVLLCASSCLVGRIDRTPYQQSAYYQQFRQIIRALPADTLTGQADTLQVGWAKVNITPSQPTALAGYGHRRGQYESVHDSIWARAFVFDNGLRKVAFVTLDLLIVPPALAEALAQQLPAAGFSPEQTYLTATHSHSSVGGWAPRLAGWAIGGSYHPEWVQTLAKQITRAVQAADTQKQTAQLGVLQYPAGELVNNRVVRQGPTDSLLRVLKIRQGSGKTAVLTTFSAHPTCLRSRTKVLSRDYPGALVDSLEKRPDIDFAAFCAGAVGSHSPQAPGEHFERVGNMAYFLSQKILVDFEKIPLSYEQELKMVTVPLPLREPQWRISKDMRLRPWAFYGIFGKYPATLKGLRIGHTVWAGAPCDISGELVPAVQKHVPGTPLFVTSFNGGYIGYITNDAYYDLDHYETRHMNWYGPGNGAYLSEALGELVEKVYEP